MRIEALAASAMLLCSCDCFFDVEGRVVECGTSAPVAAVVVDVHIDRGFRDRQGDYPASDTTDAMGRFHVGFNEPCESWGTLTFRKDGFTNLQVQYKGAPKQPVELCLSRVAAP